MADHEPEPGFRFPSLEREPDASAGGAPADDDLAPAQRLQAIWHLVRLVLTVSLIVVGGFMSSCGTFLGVSQLAQTPFGPDSRSAPGVVVRHQRSTGIRPRGAHEVYGYAPVVRYTVDGRDLEITSRLSTNTPVAVGERVLVRYPASAPGRAVLVGWPAWAPAFEWTTIGGALLTAGIVCWRRRWWLRPESWW
jgi:hypothetical protein